MSEAPMPGFHELVHLIGTDPHRARDLLSGNPSLIEFRSEHVGETALHWFAIENNLEVVRLLIAQGANVNNRNDFGGTPLGDAVKVGGARMCELLIGHGADINAQDEIDESPLTTAIGASRHDLIRLLIAAGADVNLRGSLGQTPLFNAWDAGDDAVIAILIDAGAQLEVRDELDSTLLHYAVTEAEMRRTLATAEGSIDAGADLEEARRIGALIRRGADPRAISPHGVPIEEEFVEVLGLTAAALNALAD